MLKGMTVNVDIARWTELQRLAYDTGRSTSELCREAIERYLAEQKEKASGRKVSKAVKA